jgi:chromosome segregation ATPase
MNSPKIDVKSEVYKIVKYKTFLDEMKGGGNQNSDKRQIYKDKMREHISILKRAGYERPQIESMVQNGGNNIGKINKAKEKVDQVVNCVRNLAEDTKYRLDEHANADTKRKDQKQLENLEAAKEGKQQDFIISRNNLNKKLGEMSSIQSQIASASTAKEKQDLEEKSKVIRNDINNTQNSFISQKVELDDLQRQIDKLKYQVEQPIGEMEKFVNNASKGCANVDLREFKGGKRENKEPLSLDKMLNQLQSIH